MPPRATGSRSTRARPKAKGKGVSVAEVLNAIAEGKRQPLYLVGGDRVTSEPLAQQIAQALADAAGCEVETRVRPDTLAPLLADLRTLSLFASAKVILAVDTAILANRGSAADLIDQAEQGLPLNAEGELSGGQRRSASRLLQALRVFGIDPLVGDAQASIDDLPDWALTGGTALRKKQPRGRSAKARKALAASLGGLLEAARQVGLVGFADGDLAELEQLAEGALPPGHALVLAEPSAASDHPLVQRLASRGAAVMLAQVEAGRDGEWQGLEPLVASLAEATGVDIAPDALTELARRTLKTEGDWGAKRARANATGRLAAEYRKLAGIIGEGTITRAQVVESVEDRGEEDVWQILGALGEGRGDEAMKRYRRLIAGADEPIAARLSFFSLLAGFCRQLTATVGVMQKAGVSAGERNYYRFKERLAPALQADLPSGETSPLRGLHPFRLHKSYLAASRLPRPLAARLPWMVLETEQRVKGASRDADAAISHLLGHLATALRAGQGSSSGRSPGRGDRYPRPAGSRGRA